MRRTSLVLLALAGLGAAWAGTFVIGGTAKLTDGLRSEMPKVGQGAGRDASSVASGWGRQGLTGSATRLGSAPRLSGAAGGVVWGGRHGRSFTVLFDAPRPLDALESVPCPPGEWVELSLLLEGELAVAGGRTEALTLERLTVVLDEPVVGGPDQDLWLDLPEASTLPVGERALQVWLEDGILAQSAPVE